ncbi:MAG: radical SAM protein [Pseudomonadota bacterium]
MRGLFINMSRSFISTAIRKILHIPESSPRFAQICITNCCNLDCKMCIRNYIDIERTHMDYELFKKVVDRLEAVKTVILVGIGETLTYPRFYEAIRYCKERGLEVQITTNGLLLEDEEKMEKVIRSKLDWISFSIESLKENSEISHPNVKALRNIKRLIEMKKELGSLTPRVTLQPILFSDKVQDVYEIIKWGAENCVDRINVVRVDLRFVPDMKRPNLIEEREIFNEFARLRKRYKIRIDYLQDQIFDGWKGFFYKYFKFLLRLDTYCYRFQDFVFIAQNGDVYPCCFSKELNMGNMLEKDIREVWCGEKFNYLRKHQEEFDFCRRCDFLRIKQVV